MLFLGIPKEIKTLEKRVGLTPNAVKVLNSQGFKVLVESNAGFASGFSDTEYEKAGAVIVATAKDLYAQAQVIQKVKEPLSSEFEFLRSEHILFCFLHLASQENCPLKDALVRSHCTAIGFETLRVNGKIPILAPMSQIAGGLAASYSAMIPSKIKISNRRIEYSADFLSEMEQMARVFPQAYGNYQLGNVVIFGAGVAGKAAYESALYYKGKVSFVESNALVRQNLRKQGFEVFSPEESLGSVLANADVLIGCAHAMGERASYVISKEQLNRASHVKKKILMDISIDQGGNFPESHSTSYQNPLYLDSWENVRFCVPNIPSLAGKIASEQISAISLPYTELLVKYGALAFEKNKALTEAVNISKGKILMESIRNAHQS